MAIQNRINLEEAGAITTGIYQKGDPTGDTLYIQAKHFDEHGKLRKDAVLTPEIQMTDRLSKHLLQDKDLLIIAKGTHNRACLYRSQMGPAVASSTFFVLRLKRSDLLPEFLQWYLNSPKMQKTLSNLSKGTHILSLSKKSLSKLKIEIPPLERQKAVLKLQSFWETERNTLLKLLEQKEYFYRTLQSNFASSKPAQK